MKSFILTVFILLLSFASFATIRPIHGDSILCTGQVSLLIDTTSGGMWSSSNPSIGTIDVGTGVFIAISAGITTITYAIGTSYVTTIITVNPVPAPITGLSTDTMCQGETITLSDTTSGGGIWGCGPVFNIIDTMGNTAYIYMYGEGLDDITFTDSFGCVAEINILVLPAPGPIIGITNTYVDSTTVLNCWCSGIWGSTDASIATVGSTTGIVTGVSTGSTTIYCSTYCGDSYIVVTVLPPVNTPIIPAIINSSIAIYPNPTTTELTITAPNKITSITISNLLGQTVFTQNYNIEQVQVNVSNLPSSIYFVKINGTEVRKFVKE